MAGIVHGICRQDTLGFGEEAATQRLQPRATLSVTFAGLFTRVATIQSVPAATARYNISGISHDQLNGCANEGTINSCPNGSAPFAESTLADDSVSSTELIDGSFNVEFGSTNGSLPGGTERFNVANDASFFLRNPHCIDCSTPGRAINFVIRSNNTSVGFSELDLNGQPSPALLSVNYKPGQRSRPGATGETMPGTYVIVARAVSAAGPGRRVPPTVA